MRIFKVMLLAIVISSTTGSLYLASELNVVKARENNQLFNVQTVDEYLNDQIHIESTANKITASNLFQEKNVDDQMSYQLINLGESVVGQYLIYKGVLFVDEPIEYNIKLSIVAAETDDNNEQMIEMSNSTITTKGYSNIQFKLEFLSVNSANAIEVRPVWAFQNMDGDTSLILKNTTISNIIVGETNNIGVSSDSTETTIKFNDKIKEQNDVAVANNLGDNFSFKINFSNPRVSHQMSVIPYLQKKTGMLTIKAISDNGIPVSGVEYLLEDSQGKIVAKLRTDKDGFASIDNLDYGQYTLKENSNDTQYSEAPKTTYISLSKRSNNISLTTEYYSNSNLVGSIVIHAANAQSGDIFYVYDEDGNLVEELVLDENGNAISDGLKYGNYLVTGEAGSAIVNLNKETVFANFDFDYEEGDNDSELTSSEDLTTTTKSSTDTTEIESSVSNSTLRNWRKKSENYTTTDNKPIVSNVSETELQSDVSVESEIANKEYSQVNNHNWRIILMCSGIVILVASAIYVSYKVIVNER